MPHLIIVTQSEFFRDPRVSKEAILSKERGFDVTVYCYGVSAPSEEYLGIHIKRIHYICYNYRDVLHRFFQRNGNKSPTPNTQIIQQKPPIIKSNSPLQFARSMLDSFFMYIGSNLHLFLYLKNERADVIQSTDLPTLLCGVMYKYTRNAKLVYDSHELWAESLEDSPLWMRLLTRIYEYVLIKQVDAIVTVNKSISDEIAKRYNVDPPLVVLNCPRYTNHILPTIESPLKVIYQGNFARGRGLEETILAGKYLQDGIEIYLRGFDGYGSLNIYLKELKGLVLSNGLQNKVFIIPPVAMVDLVKELKGYHIGIVPYKPVNMNNTLATPNKLFEYMMAGLAVIASDLPELRRVVNDHEVGLIFNPESPEDIAEKINYLSEHPKILEKMQQNSKGFSQALFNWEIQGEKIIRMYKELLV